MSLKLKAQKLPSRLLTKTASFLGKPRSDTNCHRANFSALKPSAPARQRVLKTVAQPLSSSKQREHSFAQRKHKNTANHRFHSKQRFTAHTQSNYGKNTQPLILKVLQRKNYGLHKILTAYGSPQDSPNSNATSMKLLPPMCA